MKQLRITTFLGTNSHPGIKAVAGFLSQEMQVPVQFVYDIPRQDQMSDLKQAEIQIAWMCGLEYVKHVANSPGDIELLAAPVFSGKRYNNQAVYFSDIVVRADRSRLSFNRLRGATWVYNERRSYSGYYLMRWLLGELGESSSYFGLLLESGSHRKALQMVLDGQADVAAIDSTILDFELARRPELKDQIRVIQSLGPAPVPPWVISKQLPLAQRQEIRNLLLEMAGRTGGKAVLETANLNGFVQVDDVAYDPVRQVAGLVDH